jgi:hypothetical protein
VNVLAYSTSDKLAPPGANLAFVTNGLNAVSGAAAQSLQVLCVSPTAMTAPATSRAGVAATCSYGQVL